MASSSIKVRVRTVAICGRCSHTTGVRMMLTIPCQVCGRPWLPDIHTVRHLLEVGR